MYENRDEVAAHDSLVPAGPDARKPVVARSAYDIKASKKAKKRRKMAAKAARVRIERAKRKAKRPERGEILSKSKSTEIVNDASGKLGSAISDGILPMDAPGTSGPKSSSTDEKSAEELKSEQVHRKRSTVDDSKSDRNEQGERKSRRKRA